MLLEGSCHCQAVRFKVQSPHPYPFNLCYCSICRKTAGGGGFAINLGGEYETLEITGSEHISVYQARISDQGATKISPGRRSFCKHCASALWVWDPRWPELVHPFASAIDTPLPIPPHKTHIMLQSRANWAAPCKGPGDKQFDGYPDESLAQWHENLDLKT